MHPTTSGHLKTLSDNFYPNICDILSELDAKKKEFLPPPKRWNYGSYYLDTWQDHLELKSKFEDLLKIKLYIPPNISWGEFRISLATDRVNYKSFFHTDPFDISIVVNLRYPSNTHEAINTQIARHKQTGLEKIQACNDPKNLKMSWFAMQDMNNSDAWEVIETINFSSNSAYTFCPRHFHSPGEIFQGDTFETGRLTQHFFFNIA